MAYWDRDDSWPRYISVAERQAKAARELAKRIKKGQSASPIAIAGRTIATSFWGKAWCDNLESYSDFSNRLPRGRTYVRNGSVVDLRIDRGSVLALVSGSSLYNVEVKIAPVPRRQWSVVCSDCSGAIDSLVELLQGRFSKTVMARICQQKTGLFPSPKEIQFTCSCPDHASMCKHIAAVLYGIGARLDINPELLFVLREVDHQELIASAGKNISSEKKFRGSKRVLDTEDLSGMFGIDIAETPAVTEKVKRPGGTVSARKPTGEEPVPRKSTMDKAPGIPVKSSARPAKKNT
jgi:uncharacterized Zn finger protein